MNLEDTKDNGDQIDLNSSQEELKPRESSPKLPSNIYVPKVEGEWGNQLWEAKTKPPIEEIDLEQKTLELEIRSKYGGVGS